MGLVVCTGVLSVLTFIPSLMKSWIDYLEAREQRRKRKDGARDEECGAYLRECARDAKRQRPMPVPAVFPEDRLREALEERRAGDGARISSVLDSLERRGHARRAMSNLWFIA